jgi:hypothetical protein
MFLVVETIMAGDHRPILRHPLSNVRVRLTDLRIFLLLTAWLALVRAHLLLGNEGGGRFWLDELSFLNP